MIVVLVVNNKIKPHLGHGAVGGRRRLVVAADAVVMTGSSKSKQGFTPAKNLALLKNFNVCTWSAEKVKYNGPLDSQT